MRLLPRVNYILMPVIITVFTFMGWIVYEQFYRASQTYLKGYLEQELSYVQQQMHLEWNSYQSILNKISISQELLQYTSTDDSRYQSFVFESRLMKMLARVRRNTSQIQQIQLLGNDDKPLISIPVGNPFDTPEIDFEVKSFLQESRALRFGKTRGAGKSIQRFIYPSIDPNTVRFGIASTIVPHLLSDDRANNPNSEYYTIFLVGELTYFSQLEKRIKNHIGAGVTLQFSVMPPANDAQELSDIRVVDGSDGGLVGGLSTELFAINIVVPKTSIASRLSAVRSDIYLSVLSVILISFLVLSTLIRRQIISPITQLKERVKKSRQQQESLLSYIESDDEVAELNNSYLELLNNVERLASRDVLTGLGNRRNFQNTLSRAIQRNVERNKNIALLYIDLDNFKQVNDHHGHAAGDLVLQEFGCRLNDVVRLEDVTGVPGGVSLSRLGGDEFVVLLNDIPNPDVALAVANRILELFDPAFEVAGVQYGVCASIGIAISPEDGGDATTLLRHADAALYKAKAHGKHCCEFFTADIAEAIRRKTLIANDLSSALVNGDLRLVFMPIYEVETLIIVGVEVLLRCPTLERQGIGPDQFIPIAESTGLIRKIDLWVLDSALACLKCLQTEHGFSGYLAINISGVELHSKKFPQKVDEYIQMYSIDPASVEIELTETALVSNTDNSAIILQQIKDLGLGLSLDDFGTGYTAFNQLIHYPVDCLKIDRSFISAIGTGAVEKAAMIDTIMALAKLYKLQVVAEGVETAEQLDYLKTIGCARAQGYLLSKPVEWERFLALWRENAKNIDLS